MREVTKEEFFKLLYQDKRDIMPTLTGRYPYVTYWRTNDTARVLFGMDKEVNKEEHFWVVSEETSKREG